MRVGMATDHGGFGLKEALRERVATGRRDIGLVLVR